jgi:hypothetical protein
MPSYVRFDEKCASYLLTLDEKSYVDRVAYRLKSELALRWSSNTTPLKKAYRTRETSVEAVKEVFVSR